MMRASTTRNLLQHIILRIFLTFVLLTITVGTVAASSPSRDELFVYAISAFDGQVYVSSFAPISTKTIYLMENENNVISSKSTDVYYWPLTQRYDADWLTKNDFVDGTLEILQQSSIVKSLYPEAYVIQYDAGDPIGTRKLAVGKDAEIAYEDFLQQRKAYQDQLTQYTKDFQEYSDEVSKIASQANGAPLTSADFPTEPVKVPDFTLYSTEVSNGFVFSFPAGTYTIRLRLPDGSIQEGSQKQLVVFAKLRQAIGYKVIPEERWTTPEYAQDPEGVIYSLDKTTLFLVPYLENEYNQQAYQRMLDPQENQSRADQTTWISFDPYTGGKMVIQRGKTEQQTVRMVDYYVSQNSGARLGYIIDEYDPNKDPAPTFTGYRFDLDQSNSQFHITLLDFKGNSLPLSERQIRVVFTNESRTLYAVAFLPLLIGLIVIVPRRIKAKNINVDG